MVDPTPTSLCSRLTSPRAVSVPIAGAVLGAVLLLGSLAGADVPAGFTVAATTSSQTNVAAPGPLTGLVDGQVVTVRVTAPSGGEIAGLTRVAQCEADAVITNSADMNPGDTGQCLDVPFPSSQGQAFIQDVPKDSPAAGFVETPFKVGVGTKTVAYDDGTTPPPNTITCNESSPCSLWIATSHNVSGGGTAFTKYTLSFAAGTGSTSSSSPTSSSTTVVSTSSTTGGTSSSTSTTAGGSTSTTAAGGSTSSTSSTTSTTLPAGTTVSPTAAAGGSITVSSTGWKAGATVTGVLHSDPVTLGTLTADATGKVAGPYVVPAGTPAGAHTLSLTGLGASGATRTIDAAVTITSTSATTSSTAPGTNIPRTGGNVLRVGLSGVLLACAGWLFAVTARQRRGRLGPLR
jgi:hypothetical protein